MLLPGDVEPRDEVCDRPDHERDPAREEDFGGPGQRLAGANEVDGPLASGTRAPAAPVRGVPLPAAEPGYPRALVGREPCRPRPRSPVLQGPLAGHPRGFARATWGRRQPEHHGACDIARQPRYPQMEPREVAKQRCHHGRLKSDGYRRQRSGVKTHGAQGVGATNVTQANRARRRECRDTTGTPCARNHT
jgi:hypothetical protein